MWINYNEDYAVSDDGEVKTIYNGKLLKGHYDKDGYKIVSLGKGKNMKVHRLVAICFLPRIDIPKLEVDHVNRNKTDNNASNLRWCDRATNNQNNASDHISHIDRWRVKFTKDRKVTFSKSFSTLTEAIEARNAFKLSQE
jgi:hypothetical protein